MDNDERAGHDAHAQGQTGGAADLVPLFDENLVFAILRALEFVGGSGESRRRRAARRIFDSAGAKQPRMDRAIRRDRVGRIEIEARGGGENLGEKRGRRASAFERGARADGNEHEGRKGAVDARRMGFKANIVRRQRQSRRQHLGARRLAILLRHAIHCELRNRRRFCFG